jgi:hypothetical protein
VFKKFGARLKYRRSILCRKSRLKSAGSSRVNVSMILAASASSELRGNANAVSNAVSLKAGNRVAND